MGSDHEGEMGPFNQYVVMMPDNLREKVKVASCYEMMYGCR